MPLPLVGKIISDLLQADPATPAALDAIQHLIDPRPLRQPAQLTSEILLQRLAALLSPASQGGVHILRNIPHEHVWRPGRLASEAAARALTPVRGDIPLASRAVNLWHLDGPRMASAVAHFAPGTRVI